MTQIGMITGQQNTSGVFDANYIMQQNSLSQAQSNQGLAGTSYGSFQQ